MKKCTYLLLAFAYLFLLVFAASCGDKCSGCPKDKEFPAEMELRIPYQVGQVVRFANAAGDTISLECANREYFNEEKRPMELPYSDCCPSYFVENVECNLTDNIGNSIRLITGYLGGYAIYIIASLDNVDYDNGGLYNDRSETFLDSIKLNGKTFYDVSTGEEFGGKEISMFLDFDGQGILGFIINGEEWVIVD